MNQVFTPSIYVRSEKRVGREARAGNKKREPKLTVRTKKTSDDARRKQNK